MHGAGRVKTLMSKPKVWILHGTRKFCCNIFY